MKWREAATRESEKDMKKQTDNKKKLKFGYTRASVSSNKDHDSVIALHSFAPARERIRIKRLFDSRKQEKRNRKKKLVLGDCFFSVFSNSSSSSRPAGNELSSYFPKFLSACEAALAPA